MIPRELADTTDTVELNVKLFVCNCKSGNVGPTMAKQRP